MDQFEKWFVHAAAHFWMLFAVVLGIAVSVVTSDDLSFRVNAARVLCGLFCAALLPGPTLDVIGRDPAIWGNMLAGLYAMTGYALVRLIVTIDHEKLLKWATIARGGKPGGDKK